MAKSGLTKILNMTKPLIIIGADHRGFRLKQELVLELESRDYKVISASPEKFSSTDDYPDQAFKVAALVLKMRSKGVLCYGILTCGSGIGMYIAANKLPGIRAAMVDSVTSAKLDRLEHDPHILITPSDDSPAQLLELIEAWLEPVELTGRHLRRINKINIKERLDYTYYPNKGLIEYFPRLVPAILTTDKSELADKVMELGEFSEIISIDITEMDFVGAESCNLTEVIEAIKNSTKYFTVHLMQKNPLESLRRLNNIPNVLCVYVHAEANIEDINQEWSFSLGLSFNPATAITAKYFDYSIIQLMSIEPGAQGRPFRKDALIKMAHLREQGYLGEIHLDGGINITNLAEILTYSPDLVTLGSSIIKAVEPKIAYANLIKLTSESIKND